MQAPPCPRMPLQAHPCPGMPLQAPWCNEQPDRGWAVKAGNGTSSPPNTSPRMDTACHAHLDDPAMHTWMTMAAPSSAARLSTCSASATSLMLPKMDSSLCRPACKVMHAQSGSHACTECKVMHAQSAKPCMHRVEAMHAQSGKSCMHMHGQQPVPACLQSHACTREVPSQCLYTASKQGST